MESHLLQMRGLKHALNTHSHTLQWVASFTDAWIETVFQPLKRWRLKSRIFYRCVD